MAAAWPEITQAAEGKRRELVLTGNVLAQRLEASKGEIPKALFKLTELNFIDLSGCRTLTNLPDEAAMLTNLTSLVLAGNAIRSLPGEALSKMTKLKVLDFSNNDLEQVPDQLGQLGALTTLNLSHNRLTSMPPLQRLTALSRLDVGDNLLESLDFACQASLVHLAEVSAPRNKLAGIPAEVSHLPALKKLDLSANVIVSVPGELATSAKLKELVLIDNPLKDNRLKKLVAQKGTKAVLDYIGQHCPKVSSAMPNADRGGATKGKKGKLSKANMASKAAVVEEDVAVRQLKDLVEVLHVSERGPKVVMDEEAVKNVRPFIVCFVVRDVDLTGGRLRQFIQAQTKLHETACAKRVAATVATHDLAKIGSRELLYTAKPPSELMIMPLGKNKEMSADGLVGLLKAEAEQQRKEKKRNTISGIHQYLNLLNNKDTFACLVSQSGSVISFPPITNSDLSKITESTTDVLVEVTSDVKLQTAKDVADAVIKEMLQLGLGRAKKEVQQDSSSSSEDDDDDATPVTPMKRLQVEQVKVVGTEGSLKVVYPSKTDLPYAQSMGIEVKRT